MWYFLLRESRPKVGLPQPALLFGVTRGVAVSSCGDLGTVSLRRCMPTTVPPPLALLFLGTGWRVASCSCGEAGEVWYFFLQEPRPKIGSPPLVLLLGAALLLGAGGRVAASFCGEAGAASSLKNRKRQANPRAPAVLLGTGVGAGFSSSCSA